MKPSTLLIVGGVGVAAYFLLGNKTASAATATGSNKVQQTTPVTTKTSNSGLLLLGVLDKVLGATWNVAPNTVQTIDYTRQGYAIGDYAGMTQAQANAQATTDYNNQFLNPFGTSPFAF